MNKKSSASLIISIFCVIAFSENKLPPDRKGDWTKAGFFRVTQEQITIAQVQNVIQLGVLDTGTDSNNTNATIINAAIKACQNIYTYIYFPEGVYRITSPLIIENQTKIIIRGDGSQRTKLIFHFNGANNQPCIGIFDSKYCGIENISVQRMDSTDFGDNIALRAQNCWVSGVESATANSTHISVHGSDHIEIRGCYIHHAWNSGTGGHGYGVLIGHKAALCLVEDNIFNHLRHSVIFSNSVNNNVVGYNYSRDPFTTEKYLGISDWPSDMCLHGHPDSLVPGPDRNLFEGNICSYMYADNAWHDNGPYNTYFRNRATGYGLHIYSLSDSQNIIANEVDDSDGSLPDLLWNAFSIESTENYVMGNTNFDLNPPVYPKPYEISNDVSLYCDPEHLPEFLKTGDYWPPIGVVDSIHLGKGINPAKKRWDNGGQLTVNQPPHATVVATHQNRPFLNVSASIKFKKISATRFEIGFFSSKPDFHCSLYTPSGVLFRSVSENYSNQGCYRFVFQNNKKLAAGIYILSISDGNDRFNKTIHYR
jgi:hypothetical protein